MTDLSHNNNLKKNQFKALIMAGGTGGHIFPGLAVAQEFQRRNWLVYWLGSEGGMEVDLIGKTNIPLNLISIAGLRGNGLLGWIKVPFTLLRAIFQSMKIIRNIKPDVVIGFGGFASGPGGLAAFLNKISLVIHEQNAVAGLTNRVLAKLADQVFQAFPKAFKNIKKIQTIGNPIRKEITDLNKIEQIKNKVNLLVIGGSRGARIFNQVLPKILATLIIDEKINVRHQCGKGNIDSTTSNYNEIKMQQEQSLNIDDFIDNMEDAYMWADLVICRAGALTVSEIAAVGVAAIFIPFPYAVDDHQTKNALWMVEQDAAVLVDESELKSATIQKNIITLIEDQEKLNDMAARAKNMAYLNTTEIMVEACENLVGQAA